jgi:hypothetical protein
VVVEVDGEYEFQIGRDGESVGEGDGGKAERNLQRRGDAGGVSEWPES